MLKKHFLIVTALCCSASLFAQGVKTPAPSPHQVITQDFGLSRVTIDYSRPGVKGRAIFGALIPYDQEWRTGANSVTTLEFGQDVQLEGHDVKAGKYALYTIPTKGDWTIILNKDVKNWGTEYNPADNVLSFKVPSYQIPVQAESFTINIDSLRDSTAVLYLLWEHTYVPIHMSTRIDQAIMAQINQGMAGSKKPYVAAARYYLQSGRNLHQALNWVNTSLKQNSKAANVYYLKAQIQAKMKDKAGAMAAAKQGIAAAKAAHNDEYVKLNEKLLASLQ